MTSQLSSDAGRNPDQRPPRWALWLATFFGAGYVRFAPGTWASFITVALWAFPIHLGVPWFYRLAIALLIFAIGVVASQLAVSAFGKDADPGAIVIDEVAGQSLALVFCAPSVFALFAAFAFFRFFDILKPWPISWLDRRVKGGLGIMLDDMVAGLFAGLFCWIF